MHPLTVCVGPFSLYKLCEGKERLIKSCDWDFTWIQILDSLSYDIHTMLYHSWSGRLLVAKGRSAHCAGGSSNECCMPIQWYAHW